ncbi:MAG: hypothetical protein M1830_008100 [Pleopsidium flavum]|nr:MAG: hypothetical protein M1830_008100 [Pleopsidium flavum]
MNCPSRTDETIDHEGWNQNPSGLAADLTTREDLNGIANSRAQRDHLAATSELSEGALESNHVVEPPGKLTKGSELDTKTYKNSQITKHLPSISRFGSRLRVRMANPTRESGSGHAGTVRGFTQRSGQVLAKYSKFIGPGFMIAVAYIDPGNYSTDVSAGAATRFGLLFIVLMSNVFAIFLQSLCVKLGSVTGLNLAEHCRAHLPRWLNLVLYVLAEAAIIATDIAEVIGSAIALNLLLKIPLVAGCALTIVDVLVILIFYSPSGSMRRLRAFEFFVMALVLGVVICFCIELSLIKDTSVGEVFKGYLPSSAIVRDQGIVLSCGILGATVMPHSLYLGSGVVQSRLRDFDTTAGNLTSRDSIDFDDTLKYRPSLAAIRSCLTYSVVELAVSLFTFALFVNSAILIVAGASLSSTSAAEDADLFSIHELLSQTLAPAAGTIFALALLLSGTSAGIVCTIAGQMVSEGALNWTTAPWLRRLITRSISITPSIIIAAAVGKEGLSKALNGTQVALSVVLPFVSAPLIYFTCRNKYMTVPFVDDGEGEDSEGHEREQGVKMRNHWITVTFAVLIWLVIVIMNVALLVLVALGKA